MGGALNTHREVSKAYKILIRNLKETMYLRDLDVDGRILLK
jgi:hypothetical protein